MCRLFSAFKLWIRITFLLQSRVPCPELDGQSCQPVSIKVLLYLLPCAPPENNTNEESRCSDNLREVCSTVTEQVIQRYPLFCVTIWYFSGLWMIWDFPARSAMRSLRRCATLCPSPWPGTTSPPLCSPGSVYPLPESRALTRRILPAISPWHGLLLYVSLFDIKV